MSIFKAYDVRGRYPDEINEEVVERIAQGLAGYFGKGKSAKVKGKSNVIVIGHDARLSSPRLYEAVRKPLVASGYTLVAAKMITTPMLYFLVNHHKAAGGIMITASHNPPEWNGIKAVREKAMPISGEEMEALAGQ